MAQHRPHSLQKLYGYPPAGKLYCILALSTCLLLVASGCGGCPWNRASDVSTSPNMSCLELRIHNKKGDTHPGGCVNPHLVGSNNCQETLAITITDMSDVQTYTFAPGEQVDVLVPLGISVSQGNRHYDFDLPAMLGEQPISISFYTFLR